MWRSSFAHSLSEDHCYLAHHPSLLGGGVPTSATSGAAPVTAMLDSIIILHVGSTAKDERLVLESRKRYAFAINCLLLDTSRSKPKMSLSGLMMVATGILVSEVLYPPILSDRWLCSVSMEHYVFRCCTLLIPSCRCIPRNQTSRIRRHGSVRSWACRPLYADNNVANCTPRWRLP